MRPTSLASSHTVGTALEFISALYSFCGYSPDFPPNIVSPYSSGHRISSSKFFLYFAYCLVPDYNTIMNLKSQYVFCRFFVFSSPCPRPPSFRFNLVPPKNSPHRRSGTSVPFFFSASSCPLSRPLSISFSAHFLPPFFRTRFFDEKGEALSPRALPAYAPTRMRQNTTYCECRIVSREPRGI